MVLTEPTVPSAQLLGLGSKLYPYGNKQHYAQQRSYSIKIMQSLLSMPKLKYRREQAKERLCQQVATDAAPYLV